MFGISTHLYVGDRLDRDHLVEIAAHGFEAVEVFAVKSHFDYRDRRAAAGRQLPECERAPSIREHGAMFRESERPLDVIPKRAQRSATRKRRAHAERQNALDPGEVRHDRVERADMPMVWPPAVNATR